ncbi:MAG: hypothetical protein KAJ46_06070, partial [Sedimentisphaerales bacterium]|nr:hypothetical protein [Sedimentisphaerales bacterium]
MPDKISQKAKGENITQVAGDVNIAIDINVEIDDAAKFIREGKCSEAINILERLWRHHNDKMTARQKYRTQANIGHAYDQIEEFDNAARYWLKAVQYDPDYEEAQARQACAYFYQGNIVKAREIAEGILTKYLENTLARIVWIKTSPKNDSVDDIESQIPEHQKDDADMLMALAFVASDSNDYNRAEKYVTKALQESEEHPKIKEQLGRLLLHKAGIWCHGALEN